MNIAFARLSYEVQATHACVARALRGLKLFLGDRASKRILFVFIAALLVTNCTKHNTIHALVPVKPARIGSTENGMASWYGEPYNGRRASSGEVFDMETLTAAHRTLPFDTWLNVTNLDNGKHVDVRITDRGPFVDDRIIDLSKAAAREIDMLGSGTAKVRLKVIKPPKNAPKKTDVVQIAKVEAAKVEIAKTELPKSESTKPSPSSTPARVVPTRAIVSVGNYVVQAGAFSDQHRAEALRDLLLKNLPPSLNAAAQDLTDEGGSEQSDPASAIQQPLVRIERRAGSSGASLWFVLVGNRISQDAAAVLAAQVKAVGGEAIVVRQR